MLKIFKRTARDEMAIAEPKKSLKSKTTTEIIEEIHESFFTEVDKLFATAKVSNSLDTNKQALLDKCKRLKTIGFTNTKEVKEAEIEIERINNLQKENEQKQELIEAINFFSIAYPTYKFITEDSVNKICQKYGLVYGEISRYLGTVPDKNLKHIEQFNVHDEHECYITGTIITDFRRSSKPINMKYITKEEHEVISLRRSKQDEYALLLLSMNSREINLKCPLEIAAPIKDFDMKGMEVKDNKIQKIQIPDPIVLKPVVFKNKKHYLIVTAWGEEASDEIVVNQQMN
jgi:hypothetical protein